MRLVHGKAGPEFNAAIEALARHFDALEIGRSVGRGRIGIVWATEKTGRDPCVKGHPG